MLPPMKRPIVLVVLSVCLIGCGRQEGMVVTHDGRLVGETPEVANGECAYHLGQRAADAAGPGWKATAHIDEVPERDLVKADEYGWRTMTVLLTLVPPSGTAVDAAARTRAEAAVLAVAHYRVPRASDIHLTISQVEAGTPPPGSQRYTSVAGDTWAGISTAFYGTSQHWRLIADANPGVEASPLPASTPLVIPPKP